MFIIFHICLHNILYLYYILIFISLGNCTDYHPEDDKHKKKIKSK